MAVAEVYILCNKASAASLQSASQKSSPEIFIAGIIQYKSGLLFTLGSMQGNHLDYQIHCSASCILALIMLGGNTPTSRNENTISLTLYKGEVVHQLQLHLTVWTGEHPCQHKKFPEIICNVSADLLMTFYYKEMCSPVLGLTDFFVGIGKCSISL